MRLSLALAVFALCACTNDLDDSANVLPGDLVEADAGAGGAGGGGGEVDAAPTEGPAFYRFTSIDINQLGSQSVDNPGFQLTTLQGQWAEDIDTFKLIILLELDEEAQTLKVHGGSGTANENLCTPPGGSTDAFAITPDGERFRFQPEVSTVFRIYAEADDGTSLNCTVDPEVFDAVPLTGVSGAGATDGSEMAGNISACLVVSAAETLCSCLGGVCRGGGHPDCPGCPMGSAPLSALLGNIMPQEDCETRLGEPGFIVEVDFTAERIPTPSPCE